MDEYLFRLVYGAHGGALTHVAVVFTLLGEGWVTLALLPFLVTRRYRGPALALLGVFAATAVAVALLKLAFHRVRPCNALPGVSCLWLDAPTDYSFPSGHAAGSFAFVAFIGSLVFFSPESRTRPALRLAGCGLLLATATCIALSRVYLGVHFPGDIAAGSCLGLILGVVGARVHLRSQVAGRGTTLE